MTDIVPNGHPAWVRANDHATYGGDIAKRNWQSQGSVNAQTDVDAASFCRLCADVAALQLVAPFAIITWTCNDSGTPAAPTITAANLMTGTTLSYEGDAAPSGYPSGARNGDGDCTFTFPSSPTDDYNVTEELTIRHCLPGSAWALTYATYLLSGSTVQVALIDATTGSGQPDAAGTLAVW